MANNELGIHFPTGSDEFAPHLDDEAQADSFVGRIIVPVANETARDALAASLTVSSSQPLYVYRADAPAGMRTEVSQDGVNWRPVATTAWIGEQSFASVAGGAILNVNVTFPAGFFSVAPMVVCSFRGTSSFTAGTGTPATSGVTVTVRNVTGSSSNGILTVIAMVQPA